MTREARCITVYISDGNRESREFLKCLLAEKFLVLGVSGEGDSVVGEVIRLCPDVLVADMLTSRPDGFTVVRQLNARLGDRVPGTVLLADYTSPAVISEVTSAHVSYFFLKPVPKLRLMEAVENAAAPGWADGDRLAEDISTVLRDMGLPAHLKGYRFARDAIELAVRDPSVMQNVTKGVYSCLGERFETLPANIERAMRNAIEVAWDRGDMDEMQKIFGYTVSTTKGKPTNSEFIAMIANHLRLRTKYHLQ